MNETIGCIMNRCSVRDFTSEIVSDETLDMLLKAGWQAATGTNSQRNEFAIITDKKLLLDYSDKGKTLYLEAMNKGGHDIPYLRRMLEDPSTNLFKNASTVIFIFSAPGALTAVEDASLAAGNIMIAAKSLGLGTCWIGLAGELMGYDKFVRDIGVPNDRRLLATLTVGYPAHGTQPTARKDMVVYRRR